MANGLLRQIISIPTTAFTSSYGTQDVRTKAALIKMMVNTMVGLNVGWAIDSEVEPITNFSSSSSAYRMFIRYKNSDHLIEFYCVGGTDYKIYYYVRRVGSKDTSYSYFNGGLAIIQDTSSLLAKLGYTMIYSANWFLLALYPYYNNTVVDITSAGTNAPGFVVKTLEDFSDTSKQSVFINGYFYDTSSVSALQKLVFTGGVINGSDDVAYGHYAHYVYTSEGTEKIQKMQISNTNWQHKDIYLFSNRAGVSTGSVVNINNEQYIVAQSAPFLAIIARIGV